MINRTVDEGDGNVQNLIYVAESVLLVTTSLHACWGRAAGTNSSHLV